MSSLKNNAAKSPSPHPASPARPDRAPLGGSSSERALSKIEARARKLVLRQQAAGASLNAASPSDGRYEKLQKQFDDVAGQSVDLWEEAADIPAKTFEALQCKARIAKLTEDSEALIAQSIVDDLLAWKGRAGL